MGSCNAYPEDSQIQHVIGYSTMTELTFMFGTGYRPFLILLIGDTLLRSTDALPTYIRDYRESPHAHDLHAVFRAVRDLIGVQRVVYPGSYVHLTPSLVFPHVCYVDSIKGFGAAMQSSDVLSWLDAHREYPAPVELAAIETTYDRIPPSLLASFGLMVSLNAGAISQSCKPQLSPGAHLLVNDGHYDAARAHVDADYTLVAAFSADGSCELDENVLREYFVSRKGQSLTREMLAENEQRAPSRARHKMAREADAFLFRFR